MRNNGGHFNGEESVAGVRAGHGLLAGLLRCARCGRKLHIRYWGKSGTAARYLCDGDYQIGGNYCLGFGGATVDKRMGEEILNVISPLGIKASLKAIAQLGHQDSDRRDALSRQLQQLDYEAQRAFEQYDRADPSNRLVTDVLEQRWNEKLEALSQLKSELDDNERALPCLSAVEKEAIKAMGEDFAALWNNAECPVILKKKIARTVIEEILVDLDDDTQTLHFIIHWHGGSHTPINMPKPMSGAVAHKTALEDIELIEKMASRYADDEIARVLSKLERRTGKGNRWTQTRVAFVRKKYNIAPPDSERPDTDILSLGQAVQYCGVSNTTLMRLIEEKILAVNQVAPYAPLEINRSDLNSEPVASILQRLKTTGKLILKGDTLGNQTSLFD